LNSQTESSGIAWMRRILSYGFLLLAIVIAVWFVLQSQKDVSRASEGMGGRQGPGEAAPLVLTQTIREDNVSWTKEYIGRVEPIDAVDLVARVSG